MAVRASDRLAIVEVAHALLREGGAAALTARAVAEKAGTGVGSVYMLFDSLEALKLEANGITMRALRLHLTEALAGFDADPTDVAGRLLRLAEAYRTFARDHHDVWAAIFDRRTIEAPPAVASDIAALFAIIEDVLASIPNLRADRIAVVAKALWSSVHGMVYLGETGGLGPIRQEDIAGMIEILVLSVVQGLSVPDP